MAVDIREYRPVDLANPSISPEVASVYLKLQRGEHLLDAEQQILATPHEAALILSLRRGQPVTLNHIRQLKYHDRLTPATEKPSRYRIESLLAVTFDPPGPKPKSRRHIGK